MRARLALAGLAAASMCTVLGCGTGYELPTERPRAGTVPGDQSYQMVATWTAMDGVRDILLTQGAATQLFVLFSSSGPEDTCSSGGPDVPRGDVRLYPLKAGSGVPTPIDAGYFQPLRTLFNPVALTSAQNRLFVLDQGDTCLARSLQTGPGAGVIQDLRAYWRVREYDLGGGDTLSTFTDTTMAFVTGIAAGTDGSVYVSGTAVILDTLETDTRIRTRLFASRVRRYKRGPRYPGVTPGDANMPGSNWHRDTTWVLRSGSGNASVSNPRGLYFSRIGTGSLFIADRGNDQVKQVSVAVPGLGFVQVDGQSTGANFNGPEDVAADLQGFFFVADRQNRRVLRYDGAGQFSQRVDVELDAQGLALLDPVAVAVDDTLAYIADRGRAKIIRYRRRQ